MSIDAIGVKAPVVVALTSVTVYVVYVYVNVTAASFLVAIVLSQIFQWLSRHGWVTIGVGPVPATLDLTMPGRKEDRVRFVCLSDTHNHHDRVAVPNGDVLVHSGDFTMNGSPAEIKAFNTWLGGLPHKHKIVIAGNHDRGLDPLKKQTQSVEDVEGLLTNCIYLNHKEVTVMGYRVYGSPETPAFRNMAFSVERGAAMEKVWAAIPEGIDVLLTHTPPGGIRDQTLLAGSVGCAELALAVRKKRPKLHVFGHIHEAYGEAVSPSTIYVNAAICNLLYRPSHPPVVVDLPVKLKTTTETAETVEKTKK